MNAVIEKDQKDKNEFTVFLTTQEIKDPLTIIKQYSRRWAIENEGIRELSQKHKIRELGGRTHNPIMARLTLALMTYNALKIFRMKWEDRYEEQRQLIKQKQREAWLSGEHRVIAYAQDHFATFTHEDFYSMVFEGGRRQSLQQAIERAPPKIKSTLIALQKEILKG